MSGPLLTNLKLTLILTTHSMLTHYFVEVLTHSLTHSLTPFRFRSFVLDLPASHDLSHWWTACFFPFGQRIPAIAIDISPLVASLNGCLDLTHEMVCHQSLKGAASTSPPANQSTNPPIHHILCFVPHKVKLQPQTFNSPLGLSPSTPHGKEIR